jgi:hypothetical protein
MSGQERRRTPRSKAPNDVLVAWQTGTQKAVSRLDTIALGGLFILTKAPAAKQSMVQLLVEAPTGDVRARAVVRWSKPETGMGVEFVAMAPEDRARLAQFLHRLSPA